MIEEHWRETGRAQRYSRWKKMSARLFAPSFPREIVEAVGPLDEGATVVDLGAGPGLLCLDLHKLWPQARFICVDPSGETLKIATENAALAGIPDLEARQGNAERIPIEPDCVTVVVGESSRHEWADPRIGFSEVHRILVPGGRLVLKDYSRSWPSGWMRKILGRFHYLNMFKFTLGEVVGWLEEAGFTDVRGKEMGPQFLVQAAKRREGG